MTQAIRTLIADDEPLLRADLAEQLGGLWPELEISEAGDGREALERLKRDDFALAFLDIRMPALSGLAVAEALQRLPNRPLLVFVTAYDQYAIDAFEHAALDYLLKPVEAQRLARCVARLRERLQNPAPLPDLAALLSALRTPPVQPLRWIRAAVGESVRMIPVDDVVYFSATDKYVLVLTRDGEALIRTPLRELAEQLDPAVFQQVHRGTIVNLNRVIQAAPDGRGHLGLKLAGRPEMLTVSRSYVHLFKQM